MSKWKQIFLSLLLSNAHHWKTAVYFQYIRVFLTQSRLNSLDFNQDDVIKILRALNIHKCCGHDDISIRTIVNEFFYLKIQLYRLITLIFGQVLISFLRIRRTTRNYLITINQFLFLPIFRKIFEKIIFNKIYNFQLDKKLRNPNESWIRPSDPCINQLLAITREVFEDFDCNPFLIGPFS